MVLAHLLDTNSPHLSDRPENFCEQRLLVQHKREALHQRTQPCFRHRRDQVIEHAALTEQRMDAALGSVGLEHPVVAQRLAGGAEQRQQHHRESVDQPQPITPLGGFDMHGTALLRDGMLHLQAYSGMSAPYGADYAAQFPRPVDTSTMFGRAILSRNVMQTGDLRADRDHFASQMRTADFHSIVAVPILREGTPIGAIALGRNSSGGFTDIQIELLQTFAEQAVIAISSAEFYRELQERTAALARRNSEYGERIEHQSATIDVLKVMSASPGDTGPVFDQIVQRASELCNGRSVALFEYDGSLVHRRSFFGELPETSARFASMFPMPPARGSIACRAILDRQIRSHP